MGEGRPETKDNGWGGDALVTKILSCLEGGERGESGWGREL